MADVQRLEAVLGKIKADPEHYDQGMWARKDACGTTYCFAGWAIELYGKDQYEWAFGYRSVTGKVRDPQLADWAWGVIDRETGAYREAPDVARELLGLTRGQADRIFAAWNNLEAVEDGVKAVANDPNAFADYDWFSDNDPDIV